MSEEEKEETETKWENLLLGSSSHSGDLSHSVSQLGISYFGNVPNN